MIATVRIAPVEQWCEVAAAVPGTPDCIIDYRPAIGHAVEIETSSCRQSKVCNGKMWRLKEGFEGYDVFLCEHMLAMD